MRLQVLLIAKAPVPGQVKTRLCPPCRPEQAAAVARAALDDTVDTLSRVPCGRRTVLGTPGLAAPPAWHRVEQRGSGLADRLANGFADTADPSFGSVLVGMDTPQLTVGGVAGVARILDDADAVIGPAEDGGWWLLALRDPARASLLRHVPMSTPETGALTRAALRAAGLRIAVTGTLRDVDTAADARAVAATCRAQNPASRFAAAVDRVLGDRDG